MLSFGQEEKPFRSSPAQSETMALQLLSSQEEQEFSCAGHQWPLHMKLV